MHTIIVTGSADPEVDAVGEAARLAGVSVLTVGLADAARAYADASATGDAWTVVLAGPAVADGLDGVAEYGDISGLVSLGGTLGQEHVDLIGEWPELPILAVARTDDRAALRSAVDTYLVSSHAQSDLVVGTMPVGEQIAEWLVDRMRSHTPVERVTMVSSDGWEIHGSLRVPSRPGKVPGVVLLHTGRSDRSAYSRLERLIADQGLAVLNIDWRGRGESTNLGTYFELDEATKFAAWRDARAAFDSLAADPRVDADRLAGVGCVHGAEYAVRAAWRDRRVRALVILTGYRPHEPEESALLVSGDVDVMYVNAVGHTVTGQAMRELCRRAPRGTAHFVEYPGSALGYQLFEIDHELEPRIAAWLAEVLT